MEEEPDKFVGVKSLNSKQRKPLWEKWPRHCGILVFVAQFVVIMAAGVYIYGHITYFHMHYTNVLSVSIKTWWKGRPEMVRPTYFTVFTIIPLVVTAAMLAFLRQPMTRRVTSQYFFKTAMIMRRKPRCLRWTSYWSFGELLYLCFLVIGNFLVFYFAYDRRYKRLKIQAAAKKTVVTGDAKLQAVAITFGFNAIYNLSFLFIPVTRHSIWLEFLNISYANGVKYHRWLGILTIGFAFLHCACFYSLWIRKKTWKTEALPCFDCPLSSTKGRHAWINIFGEIALVCFLVIGLSSIPMIRRKFYNLFYYTHHLFTMAMIFAVMHYAGILWWIFPTLLLYIVSRTISASSSFAPVQVKELAALDNDIVKITLHRSTQTDGHFHVGQFLYINVPALSKLQWHAFTIASSPHANPTTLTLYIKSLGDWTRDLVTYANDCKQQDVLPTVYVDGYYGSSLGVYEEYSTLCLIGGGIGATPMFAILEDLVSKTRLRALQQRVVFIFAFRDLVLLKQIHPLLVKLQALDPGGKLVRYQLFLSTQANDEVLDRKLHLRQENTDPPTKYEKSRRVPCPFSENLQLRSGRLLATLSAFVFAWLIVIYLEYGGGKIQSGTNTHLWPLQRFVEVIILFAGGIVFPALFFAAERLIKRHTKSASMIKEVAMHGVVLTSSSVEIPSVSIQTYRDLLTEHNAVVGARPDISKLLQQVLEFHTKSVPGIKGHSVIGTFVSGPVEMKQAVACAVSSIGANRFDVHEEEFEL
ncbi:hypothetical protein Poli38472_006985 [Pythium oligandrum]|uniref:FAD-binding FR-type domain-containing protein n=1 Tax=Pythium oligandrum TaxID=41045 RepID=A0A8K1C995_PYTOL|nr:hypothetical protein Poli38472_006985 [Pythium oligandrum]|eukprot:TMW58840.1 hypothetical protein Poli38472_006985 [Pythium oligandrum]